MNILKQLRHLLNIALIGAYIIGVFGSDDDTLPETCGSDDPSTGPIKPKANSPSRMNLTKLQGPNPFPFLSLSDKRKVIAEGYPNPNQLALDSNLICYQTYHFLGNGDSESIALELRSQGYPSDAPDYTTTVTCFISPDGWKIRLTCKEFAVACGESYFGISFDGNLQSPITKYCGNSFNSTEESPWSNKLSVVFVTGRSGEDIADKEGEKSSLSKRYGCQVHIAPDKKEPTISTTPGTGGACKCGQRNTQQLHGRIIGGTPTTPHEFPWSCFIFARWPTGVIGPRCGCTLISQRWVLTTASCLRKSIIKAAFIVLGGHELNFTSLHMVTATAKRIIRHPEYPESYESEPNDIALIELDEPILFNDKVSPICLPWNMISDDFKGCTVVTSGWGFTTIYTGQGDYSPTPNKLNLKVLSNDKCREYYDWPGSIENSTICGLAPGKQSGRGDTGNSMDLQRDGRYYAVGGPDGFIRVTSYLDWIKSTTGETFCGE